MELAAGFLDNLFNRAATDLALLNFSGAPVNDLVPLRFGVSIHGFLKAGDELPGEKCTVLAPARLTLPRLSQR